MDNADFLTKLYVEHNYQYLDYCTESDILSKKQQAVYNFRKGLFQCAADIYLQLGMKFEYAYCIFLCGDLERAGILFDELGEENPACSWERHLISLFENDFDIAPTYLQIRNFLEIDFSLFIEFHKTEFATKILDATKIFVAINSEYYKYIGRVFFNYNFNELAVKFFIKWKEIEYNDPEIHYLLASCYTKMGLEALARSSVKHCLEVAPYYYPARVFFENDVKNADY